MKLRTAIRAAAAIAVLLAATPSGQAHATTGTWVWSRPIPHEYQDQPTWCVPAAFTNQLASAGATVDSTTQATLAQRFQTDSTGTKWSNAVGPLNSIVGPDYIYDVRYVASPADVMTEVRYAIDKFQAGLVAPVTEGQLPYVNDPTDTTGHDILIYGYNTGQATSDGGAFYAWDPQVGRGYEWISAAQLYAALQSAHWLYELEREQ